MKRLAIIITHPIQYYAPVFQLLAKECDLKVFYTWGADAIKEKYDPDFGKAILWDIPLLEGYNYTFLNNIAKDKGSHHAKGIINPSIIKEIETFKPNAILVYGWLYHSHRQVLYHFKGKTPIWFRGDSTLLNPSSILKAFVKKIFLKKIYKNVDKAFFVGDNNKQYFLEYGLKAIQLFWAPHATDNNRFAQNKYLKNFRAELNIPAVAKVILFAGKFEPNKNPLLLLEAFFDLINNKQPPPITKNNEQKTVNEIHLVFVGNGILEQELKQKTQAINDEQSTTNKQQIHFLPFQNQSLMPSVYQMADVFCLPSNSETWGLAINEAMACSKAIIASNKVGCAIDLVENSKNGYIFKHNNKKDLIEKLFLALEHSEKMGTDSYQKIEQWSFTKQVQIFIQQLKNNEA